MRTLHRNSMFRRLVAAVLTLGVALDATANPTGMTVQSGSATATANGSQLTVTASQNASLNWQSFNIASGETTLFQQPSSTSIVWNQINNANPSQIYGSLQANGIVVLLNSSGFYFGPNSFVSAAGLVVSTANCAPPQNSGGGWEFNGPPPLASIVNYGQIKVGNGGSAFLIADQIENHGTISASGGTVGLAAGQTVLLSDRPDGRGMSMQVTLPSGSVDNEGRLIADGGTIAMNAKVVNQDGFIQANSVRDVNGTIELVASDQLTLGANSQIIASGDNSPAGSAGGNVTLQSGNDFSDSVGSQIITTGGTQGGNGGNVEISAPNVLSLNSGINASAQAGWTAGKLLLDPDYIILDTSGSGSAGSGTVLAGNNSGSTLDLNVNTAFANLAVSQIILQAVYDITLAGGTAWNLSQTIGANFGGVTSGQLTLEAGRNIIFGNGSQITDANNWSVALDAGYNFANNTVQSGYGNIYLNGGSGQSGNGSIQLSQGSINLTAGNSVVAGSGCQLIDDGGTIGLYAQTVNQDGHIIDNGGTIGLYAQTVDQDGLIQANSVGNQHGIIELVASDSLTLGADSVIQANGDNSASGSAGGQIMLQTAQIFSDVSGSQIEAVGGANGGNGGRILVYAAQSSVNSTLDVSAQAGSTAGSLYYYPRVDDLTLTASLLAPFAGFSHVLFQANDDITIAAGQTLNLGAGSGQLTLEAGGDITFGNDSQITDANNWSATLEGGYDFVHDTVQSGIGNIYLNGGSGSIQLSQASINLTAGNSIVVGSGCQLIDDGGTIGLYAPTVDQYALIQANSVGNQHGIIELVAADQLNLYASSVIQANGDNSASGSAGGQIMLQTAQTFSDVSGSQVEALGGASGGNGGRILVYAAQTSVNSTLDVSAQAGSTAGSLYYYPRVNNLTLTTSLLAPFAGFSHILFQANDDITIAAGQTLNLGAGSGQLTLEAGDNETTDGNIIFQNGSQITDANNWSVTLQAGYDFASQTVQSGIGNIYLNGGAGLSGGGSIQTANGDINLAAGQNITVGSGYVITTGGGSISAHALVGNIDTGSDAQGYHFVSGASSLSQAYNLNNGLGGISTAAGGDVTLIAGGDVTSVLPGKGVYYDDGNSVTPGNGNDYLTAGSGAYGSQPGNVTIVAGGNVTGHYLVANGTGSIFAGVQMDANGNPTTDSSGNYVLGASGSAGTDLSNNGLALSLVSGGWNVTAAQDIYLQEVRNPNGDFDYNGGTAYNHYFNYAPGDYVNLSAGNLVQLGASSTQLPRLSSRSDRNYNVPVIYPPILNITAGDGGVILGAPGSPTSLTLFPSPQGSLTIDTTGSSGSLISDLNSVQGAPQLFNLIVSDSGSSQYTSSTSFGINDHATSPVHLDALTPIVLNISGDMNYINLVVPEAAQIKVDGNMNNCGFQGMNLAANDVTSINVSGDIINRSSFTDVDLSQVSGEVAPLLSYLSQAEPLTIGNTSISAATLATSFYYDSTTHLLTYENIPGVSLASLLQNLQNLTIQVYQNGVPQFDSNGNPVTTTVSILNAADAQALLAQYNALNVSPYALPYNASSYGYFIGGGGQFDITARTIDLGTSAGIQSEGVALYTVRGRYPLAQLFGTGGVFDHGADITITTTGSHSDGENATGDLIGDLDMYSSSIASLQGGDITIHAGGDVNAGSADFSVNTDSVRGIYSTDQGNVYVYADGDINVNGSRIAVYDTRQDNGSATPGGSVTVVSMNGNINAGNGGSGFVAVSSFLVNPDQSVATFSSTIPGSGILEVSYTDNGNVLVETPNGNVNAGAGGIIQLLLNGPPLPESTTLFDLPHDGLAKMFDLALNGKMNAALELQHALNGNPGNSAVDVFAGYELQELGPSGNPILDTYGDPMITALNLLDGTLVKTSDNQDITATGSGVIADGSVTLNASGNITGNIFTLGNINITAVNNVDVSALGLGIVDVSGSSLGTSTIIGIGGINAVGDSSGASLLSNNQISGDTSGSQGLAPGTAADAASQGMASDNSASPAPNANTTATDDDEKKRGKQAVLVQKTGRVTVILSPRQQSKAQTPEPRT